MGSGREKRFLKAVQAGDANEVAIAHVDARVRAVEYEEPVGRRGVAVAQRILELAGQVGRQLAAEVGQLDPGRPGGGRRLR